MKIDERREVLMDSKELKQQILKELREGIKKEEEVIKSINSLSGNSVDLPKDILNEREKVEEYLNWKKTILSKYRND